ncbi:MAG TPA: prepilin peptidase [Bryobacteraceae bacterium]|nr:prepilin peptidase [Bryobacteraceae bacterium]
MLWALVLTLGSIAVFEDIRSGHIPNWVTVGAFGAALLYHAIDSGLSGLGLALLGTLIGFGIFLVFYCLGALGAGDIKLMAAFGALLGPHAVLLAALLAAIIGALLAAGAMIWSRRPAIPYAPAIVMGAWLALLGRG